jgi:hypothetical protein
VTICEKTIYGLGQNNEKVEIYKIYKKNNNSIILNNLMYKAIYIKIALFIKLRLIYVKV